MPGEPHGQSSLVDFSAWGCRVGHDWKDLALMQNVSTLLWNISNYASVGKNQISWYFSLTYQKSYLEWQKKQQQQKSLKYTKINENVILH